MPKSGGIYIHIPFCRNKCLYCDFYSGGIRIADWKAYLNSILIELKSRKEELNFHPSTLYIGGGTPSLIPLNYFEDFIRELNIELHFPDWEEVTMEVNPEDISQDKLDLWKKSGINRISVGVQSLIDSELSLIGRRHNAETAVHSIKMISEYFENFSVDVMFGLPGQTLKSYSRTLNEIIKLKPTHISSYSLMLEEGTALTQLVKKNRIDLPEDNEWLKMFKLTTEILDKAGFERYEISNYACPGYYSKHNSLYWNGLPYLGLGPAAHSYDGFSIRKANPSDIKRYIKTFSDLAEEKKIFYIKEVLSKEEIWEEKIMTRMRTTQGLSLLEVEKEFGKDKLNFLLQKAQKYIARNLLKEKERYLSFTDKGFLISDSILVELI